MMAASFSGSSSASSGAGTIVSAGASLPSFSMTTLVTRLPMELSLGSMATTLPETEAWIGAETGRSESPIFWPRRTSSPTETIGVQGAPMCWDMGMTTCGGSGISRIAASF